MGSFKNMEQDLFDTELNMENDIMEGTALDLIESVPTEEEYWQFSSDALSSFLSLASQFGWRSGSDLTSKSVSLTTSEDKEAIIARATDFDSYLEMKIPLTSTRPISSTLVFPTTSLQKTIQQCGKVVVMKKDSFLFMGKWIGIESVSLDPSSYIQSDSVEYKGNVSLPILSTLIPIASSASVPRDRNIRFYTDSIQSTCLWTELKIPFESPIPFIFSAREVSLLTKIGKDIKIGITQSDLPRLVFKSSTSTLWILYRSPEKETNKIEIPDWFIRIEYNQFAKIVSLSDSQSSSSGLLQFQYSKEDQFIVTYTSRLNNASFTLSAESEGEPDVLEPASIQTKILKMYIKPLTSPTLKISWDKTAFYIANNDSSVIVSLKWEV